MFQTDATAYSNAYFGQGSGAVVLDDVQCTGTEETLVDCPYSNSTLDCTHSDDAGVRCQITRECMHNGAAELTVTSKLDIAISYNYQHNTKLYWNMT